MSITIKELKQRADLVLALGSDYLDFLTMECADDLDLIEANYKMLEEELAHLQAAKELGDPQVLLERLNDAFKVLMHINKLLQLEVLI